MADDPKSEANFTHHRPSIRVKRAAQILEVNISTIYRLIYSGLLDAHRIGKRGVRIFADSLRHYQERQKIPYRSEQIPEGNFQKSKHITNSNPAHREAVEYLRSIGCLK